MELEVFQAIRIFTPVEAEKPKCWMVRMLTDEEIEGNCIAIQSRLGTWALPEGIALMEDVLIGEDPLNRRRFGRSQCDLKDIGAFRPGLGQWIVALWDIGEGS
jgi:hypothetical protein